jgi:hypothetical protein
MQTRVSDKSNDLAAVLSSHSGGKTNLARIKLISHFIMALCKVRLPGTHKAGRALYCLVIKSHGRKAKSIFKHGLNFIMQALMDPVYQMNIDIYKFLSCTEPVMLN